MLATLDVPSDLDYPDKETFLLDYIHYQKNGIDFYFIRNTSGEWISRECGFRQKQKVPEIWDPVTGKIIPVPIFHEDGRYIRIPLSMAPFGSYLVAFKQGVAPVHYTDISYSGKNPPFMEFTGDGILFLNEGKFVLKGRSESKKIESKPSVMNIEGPWAVHFTQGWGAPDSVVLSELISWTDHENPGIKYYSGIGRYQNTFSFEMNNALPEGVRICLDLGEISEVAEVWLNGKALGIAWAKPFKFDITGSVINGDNVLTVEVANTWCNRITGDAITGEKYTSTNITRVDTLTWDKVPLNASGLMGPVTIRRIELVK
jgi:hypothetical protein